MSEALQVFMREAPEQAEAWMATVKNLNSASALDKKSSHFLIDPIQI